LNTTEIRKLIKLVESSDITELEVTEGESSIRISRQGSVAAPVAFAAPQVMAPPATTPVAPAQEVAAATTDDADREHVVKSPMVGTFYRSPGLDSDSFVNEGDKVKKGQTLCIIEAMKLMNEIEAEYAGVVTEILVDNATPLEYGQPIFVITPV
jgi:acetyl-CoA carboxylase biotin carboxyl carrier protein